jgi:lantibiotic modifying enzyme
VGEAGVAAALLRSGQVLGDSSLVEAAQARSHRLSRLPYTSPDLFNGSAGRLRLHLMVWDETHDGDDLACASAAGEHLLRTMAGVEDGRPHWTIPAGFGPLSGQTYLGYAHGAAGIADALLDLFEVTADARLFEAACGTARWLQDLAVPALDDASGLCWPTTEGAEPVAAYWCHGAAGIGRFWIHAAALGVMPGAAGIAARAIATTARGVRWAGPTQCHGLAGAIEVLIDAYQANNDPAFLATARILERLLLAFACEVDGQLAWPSESPTVITPDYNVGYAGVASALLRLADPARRPHGLSRQGFRFDSKGCRG